MQAVEDWKTETLGRVARLTMGQSPDSRYYSEEENGLPFLQGCAEFKGRFPKHLLYCSQAKKIATVGSILFSVRAPVARINIADRDYIIGRGLAGISGIEVDQVYLEHYLTFVEPNFRNASQGSTFEAINSSELNGWPIEHPVSKAEQAKIAEVLSTVDRAIEQTEALIAKQQRIKTDLMQGLLTRGIDEHGNLRSEQTHQFKDSPLGRIPVEWGVKRLWEGCDICNNLRKPIAALVREAMKGEYPYYGPTGILDYINEYRVDGKFVLIGEDGDHFLKFKTQEMTLLVNGRFNINNHAHILRGKANVLTEWLHLFFLHRDITLHLTRQGAGRFKLNKAALMELPLIAPRDPSEQGRILHVMNTLRQNQIYSISNLEKLKLKKTALMQDLLTGKKRITALLKKEAPAL